MNIDITLSEFMKKTLYLKKRDVPTILTAIKIPIADEQPDWLKKCHLSYKKNMVFCKTISGVVYGKVDTDFFVLSGFVDDLPDATILTTGSKEYREYVVCDENGDILGELWEMNGYYWNKH